MVGLSFAAVPLYDLFCRATGFDGTPIAGSGPAKEVIERAMTVRFDTNVAPGLNWRFLPEVAEVSSKVGETQTVFFKVQNAGSAASAGVATFNVQPGVAGAYFVKIQCFCYNEQTLQPGETIEVPVVFYIDPAVQKDETLRDLRSITLSYTYFASKNGQPVATTSAAPVRPNL
jgi:cytochrome c oxidase assembly protein subunit 11